ncbi:hypothetical protein L1887_57690 [Cichorium endivia]|nr:hypothetical protein L1887_57690 [Cichorium endivia]
MCGPLHVSSCCSSCVVGLRSVGRRCVRLRKGSDHRVRSSAGVGTLQSKGVDCLIHGSRVCKTEARKMEVATEPQMSAAQSEKGKREADEEVRTLNRLKKRAAILRHQRSSSKAQLRESGAAEQPPKATRRAANKV